MTDEQKKLKREYHRNYARRRRASRPDVREYNREQAKKRYAKNPEVRKRQKESLKKRDAADPRYRERRLKAKRDYAKKRYASDLEFRAKSKEYQAIHSADPIIKEKRNARFKERYRADPEFRKAHAGYQKKQRIENPKARETRRRWEKTPKVRARINARRKERYHQDAEYRLKRVVRASLKLALKVRDLAKGSKTAAYLNCPIVDFRAHIEADFWPGMSWANQGRWHLDHIKPCASFDLSDPAQQAACFHWSNWQPLWADDNMAKSDRLDWHPAESKHSLPVHLALKPWDCKDLGKLTLRE